MLHSRRQIAIALLLASAIASPATAQEHDHSAMTPPSAHAAVDHSSLHMEMTPLVKGDHADSARAAAIAIELRVALAQYRDTAAAVAAGYHMFAPNIKNQKVYHFTNNWRALQEAVRFEPTRPTSLLYTKGADGNFNLIGAMYTAPKRFGYDKLDARVPLSVARWHKHINWCVPKRGASQRWLERKNGEPVFGPESPIATKAACDAVNGDFRPTLFGWMVHANVFAGESPAVIWGDEHAGHDMHDGMKMDPDMQH